MLIIFDWDGTISDSAAKIVSCMQAATEHAGMNALDDADIRNIIGLGLPEAIRHLYPEISSSDADTVRLAYSRFFKERDVTPSPFFSGVTETLRRLKDDGHILSVATGKSRQGLDRVLANLALDTFFHSSRCADETASKPDPLMLTELLREHNHHIDDAVMIGDTEWDMRMADNIGMKKIAVTYGAHSHERLQACQPELMIDTFPQLLDWIGVSA